MIITYFCLLLNYKTIKKYTFAMDKNNLNESNKDTFHFHLGYMHMAFYRRHLKICSGHVYVKIPLSKYENILR